MASSSAKKIPAVEAEGVATLNTTDINPNPYNPRVLFDPIPMQELKESIDKVGILVPLTVYREAATGKYIILDGERRWRTARELGLKKVPVNTVREPTTIQNIITMFQIHEMREDWELMPTALKVEVLINETKETSNKGLSVLTGLAEAVVVRCKKLLSFERRYQSMMLAALPKDRIKADFFIELYAVTHDTLITSYKWFDANKFTDVMLARYLKPVQIKAVTDFRAIKSAASAARKANQAKEFGTRFRRFIDDEKVPISYLLIKEAEEVTRSRATTRDLASVISFLEGVDVDTLSAEESFWDSLGRLRKLIKQKFDEAGRRLS